MLKDGMCVVRLVLAQTTDPRCTSPPALVYWKDAFSKRTTWVPELRPDTTAQSELLNQFWDDELDALYFLIAAVRVRKNVLSPAASLPADILSCVFEHLALISPISSSLNALGWVQVTQVCSHWRSVALGHAGLWSTSINLNCSYRQIEVLLARAGTAPLSIVGNILSYEQWGHTAMIKRNLQRIKALDITCRIYEFAEELCSIIGKSYAPVLQSLSLDLDGFHPLCDSILTSNLTTGLPNLRYLTLYDMRFPWASSLPSLRSLKLYRKPYSLFSNSYYSNFTEDQATFLDILLGLSRMSALEHLTLSHIIPLPKEGESTVINLPQLRELCIRAPPISLFTMWRSLNTPVRQVSIHLICADAGMEGGWTQDEHTRVHQHLYQHLYSTEESVFPHLKFHGRYRSLHLLSSPRAIPDRNLCPDFVQGKRDLYIALPRNWWDNKLSNFPSLASTIPLHKLESLSLKNPSSWTLDEIASLFSQTVLLKHLTISPYREPEFFETFYNYLLGDIERYLAQARIDSHDKLACPRTTQKTPVLHSLHSLSLSPYPDCMIDQVLFKLLRLRKKAGLLGAERIRYETSGESLGVDVCGCYALQIYGPSIPHWGYVYIMIRNLNISDTCLVLLQRNTYNRLK